MLGDVVINASKFEVISIKSFCTDEIHFQVIYLECVYYFQNNCCPKLQSMAHPKKIIWYAKMIVFYFP